MIINPLKECIGSGHEVVEDMLVWELCKERLFCCRTCKLLYICIEKDGQVIPRLQLKAEGLTNKDLAKLLTFEGTKAHL